MNGTSSEPSTALPEPSSEPMASAVPDTPNESGPSHGVQSTPEREDFSGSQASSPAAGLPASGADSPSIEGPAVSHPAPAAAFSSAAPVIHVLSESPPQPECDVDQIDPNEYPPRQFPVGLPRGEGFRAVVRRSVLNEIHRHGQSSLDVEVCGVLVGNVFRDDAGAFLVIDASIRGSHAASRNAQVTFTAETWTSIQAEMDANHPNRRIVGWYHTHPGFGIFLSDMDLFIQGNFFNLAWQVAMVYDPKSGDEGLFIWKAGKTERTTMLVEEDVEHEVAAPPSMVVTPEFVGELAWQLTRFQKRLKKMQVLLAVVVVVAVAWPFVLYTLVASRIPSQLRQARVAPEAGAVAPQNATPTGGAVTSGNALDRGDPTAAKGGSGDSVIPASRPAAATAPVVAVVPPTTMPIASGEAVVKTTAPPATQPVRTEPPPPEIIRGSGTGNARGAKVFETQPEGPGAPK